MYLSFAEEPLARRPSGVPNEIVDPDNTQHWQGFRFCVQFCLRQRSLQARGAYSGVMVAISVL